MGSISFFDEAVTTYDEKGIRLKCQVEAIDVHSTPEIRIGPKGDAASGRIAEFDDWKQFERFVKAVNEMYDRLKGTDNSVS